MNFGRHEAFVSITISHENNLPRAQFSQTKSAQRLHVDKDILGSLTSCEEAEALRPVEPLDERTLKSACRRNLNMRSDWRQLRRVDRSRLIHGQDSERLIAAIPFLDKGYNTRTFQNCLEAVPAQAGHMQQHVLHTVIRNDKAESLSHVEPLHDASDLDQFDWIYWEILETGNAFR